MQVGWAMRDDAAVETVHRLTSEHRHRLLRAGADPGQFEALPLARLEPPDAPWWTAQGNALYTLPGKPPPDEVLRRLVSIPCRDVLIVLGSHLPYLSSLLVSHGATVLVGPDCALTAAELFCGDDSRIVLQGDVIATRCAVLDARNGGSIIAEPDQLWASDVYIATDDMHRLADRATGQRLNPHGADIRIGRHVWLCKDAVVTGNVDIGDGAVVALRSVVRGQKVPAHSVVAGVPAAVVRDNVEWDRDDLP